MKKAGNRTKMAALAGCAAIASLSAAVTFSSAQGGDTAEGKVSTVNQDAERVKTLKIGKNPDSEPVVVMSIPPGKLGNIQDGDRIEGSMEFEVTICIKADPGFEQFPCVGKEYGYNPTIRAQIVLGAEEGSKGKDNTTPITKETKVTCSQTPRNRNRHCVLALKPDGITINDVNKLPCDPEACHLNVVASASHPSAKSSHRVVVGSHNTSREIFQNRGTVNGLRLRPGNAGKPDPLQTSKRRVGKLKVYNDEVVEPKPVVVYSIPIRNAEAGDALFLDSLLVAKISGVKHNTPLSSEVIVGDKPGATKSGEKGKRATQLATHPGIRNRFTCTKGRSGHTNPCPIRKVGAVHFVRDAEDTLYINVLSEASSQVPHYDRFKPGQKVKLGKTGYLRIYRFNAE